MSIAATALVWSLVPRWEPWDSPLQREPSHPFSERRERTETETEGCAKSPFITEPSQFARACELLQFRSGSPDNAGAGVSVGAALDAYAEMNAPKMSWSRNATR